MNFIMRRKIAIRINQFVAFVASKRQLPVNFVEMMTFQPRLGERLRACGTLVAIPAIADTELMALDVVDRRVSAFISVVFPSFMARSLRFIGKDSEANVAKEEASLVHVFFVVESGAE